MTHAESTVDRYVSEFSDAEQTTSVAPGWVRRLRARGIARFGDLGFPTQRDEEWKFTSVAPIADASFTRAMARPAGLRITSDDLAPFSLREQADVELVFIDGRYSPDLSTPGPGRSEGKDAQSIDVQSLAAALASNHPSVEAHLGRLAPFDKHAFTALNTAFIDDGGLVVVPASVGSTRPIHLLFLSAAAAQPGETAPMVHARVLVVADRSSELHLVESYGSLHDGVSLTTSVCEVLVGENAVIDHYKIQHESHRAFHMAQMHVHLSRASVFSSHSFAMGGGLVRNDVVATLEGEGGDCTLNGLYVSDANRVIDNHTTIDHAKAHCGSHEVYKGILGGRARAIFNGKIVVRQDAQKTDAKQTNRAMLLSDEAQINTKPQLEIFANDVKCTHGAAVGQLDEDALFYIRTRGFSLAEARSMLIHAFAGDILNRVKVDSLRGRLEAALLAQLPSEALR